MSGSQELLARGNASTAPTKLSNGSERIDPPPVLHQDKVILCVALKRGGIERVKISRAVHEPNGRHRRCKIKEARPSARERNEARRVSTISDHVLSPFGSNGMLVEGQPSYGAAYSEWGANSLGRILIVLNLAQAGRRSSGPGAAHHRLQVAPAKGSPTGVGAQRDELASPMRSPLSLRGADYHAVAQQRAVHHSKHCALIRRWVKIGCPRNVLGESAAPQRTDINRRDFRGRSVPGAAVSNRSKAAVRR
jgi:hypothetical protein